MWTRKAAIASSLPLDLWPAADDSGLSDEMREKFRASVEAIRLYFANEPVANIERRTGISAKQLPKLAKRCLLLGSDGNILGYRALLPYVRLQRYKRSAPIQAKFPEQQAGQSGALSALFDRFPHIREELVHCIRHERQHRRVHEHRLRPRDLHRIFIKMARTAGVLDNEWPFTTKHLGLRSLEKFMKDVLDGHFARTVHAFGESEARAHLAVGTGHGPLLRYEEPYDAVEIDAYNIESHLTIAMRTPEGMETDVLLERLWLIAVVERISTAVLSYTVVYRSEVTADDVLRVMRDAAGGCWTPMPLTVAELSYPKGGGLPSGLIPTAQGALWSVTLLDGALAHLSKAVHERARKMLGFAINWGAVGHFERRPNVERTFKQIASDLFKRLPSTTGSHPRKGRAERAEEQAVRHRIRADIVEQLLDVTIAQHNATPSEGTSFLSPLQVLRYFFEEPSRGFLVRYLPAVAKEAAATMSVKELAMVRGGRDTGRRPYIQIDRVHYTSPVLADAGHLVGHELVVEIDEEDMRQVRAFLKNGMELGYLKAQGKWALSKHSRRTRKAINGLITKRMLVLANFDDPIHAYMKLLAKPSITKSGTLATPPPKQATEIARVAKESGTLPALPQPSNSLPVRSAPRGMRRTTILDKPIPLFVKIKNRR
jgi:hypothetical protein